MALIAQHGQKLPVGRDDRALRQIRNLRGRDGADVEPERRDAGQVRHPGRRIEGQAVQAVYHGVQTRYNGGNHSVHKADNVVDRAPDAVADDIPNIAYGVLNHLPGGLPIALEHVAHKVDHGLQANQANVQHVGHNTDGVGHDAGNGIEHLRKHRAEGA